VPRPDQSRSRREKSKAPRRASRPRSFWTRERCPPFSPEVAITEFATLLRAYRVTRVTGDRYAGDWPRERFRVHGISYELAAKGTTA
jgi:hypothetical protein